MLVLKPFSTLLLLFMSTFNHGVLGKIVDNSDKLNLISSGYSDELWAFSLDPDKGKVSKEKVQKNWNSSISWFEYDPGHESLYASHEVFHFGTEFPNSGVISRWTKDSCGHFFRKQVKSSVGGGPVHIALNEAKSLLFVSNYGEGSLTVYSIGPKGEIEDVVFTEKYTDPNRPLSRSNAHATYVYKDKAFVLDLGLNRIYEYRINKNGLVRKVKMEKLPKGYGPRHMAISPSKSKAFVIMEKRSLIGVFNIDEEDGLVFEKEIGIDLGPEAEQFTNYGSEIAIDSNERFLYVSNRGFGSIIVFDTHRNDEQVQLVPLQGDWPRHFDIDQSGRFLAVVTQNNKNMEIFRIEPETGLLTKTDSIETEENPAIVKFI